MVICSVVALTGVICIFAFLSLFDLLASLPFYKRLVNVSTCHTRRLNGILHSTLLKTCPLTCERAFVHRGAMLHNVWSGETTHCHTTLTISPYGGRMFSA